MEGPRPGPEVHRRAHWSLRGSEALREPGARSQSGGAGAAGLGGIWRRRWLAADGSPPASSKAELTALPWGEGEGESDHRHHSRGPCNGTGHLGLISAAQTHVYRGASAVTWGRYLSTDSSFLGM